MKQLVIAFLLFFYYIPSFGCINEYDIDAHGREHMLEAMTIIYAPFNQKETILRLKELEKSLSTSYTFQKHSDYGVNLLKLGCTPEALQVFQELIKLHPKEYSISANLGTAYELMGQNDSALKYIKLGMKLNPDSHFSSEWVHVKILEAKLKKLTDDELEKTEILGLSKIKKKEADEKLRQVLYQLHERMPFTPLGDKLLGKVLNETGHTMAEHLSLHKAMLLLSMAQLYNPILKTELNKKIQKYEVMHHVHGDGKSHKDSHDRVDLAKLAKHKPLKISYDYKVFKAK